MKRATAARPSPAFVLASIALFVALGGVSVAAVNLAKNDVEASHIAKGAVGTSEVQNDSIKAADLAASATAAVQTGVVDAAGTSTQNDTATVTKISTGHYKIAFEAGTWSGAGRPLAFSVTPFGLSEVVRPVILSAGRAADGSASFEVILSSTQPAPTYVDNGFMFIAATSG